MFRPAGPGAMLVECSDPDDVARLVAHLDRRTDLEIFDLVPALRTVLIVASPARWREIRDAASRPEKPGTGTTAAAEKPVTIPVRYDGPDLQAIADQLGVGAGELIYSHVRTRWQVAYIGFAPGFAYLLGPGWPYRPARHRTPRAAVPRGSVGIADMFSGVYPKESPGGWQLIGHTDTLLWDLGQDPPAIIQPGGLVRFTVTGS